MFEKLFQFISAIAPLLIAGFAALISEFAGLLNIGIEGLILVGAFLGITSIFLVGSSWGIFIGLLLAILVGGFLSSFIAYLALNKKGNIFILGLSINLLASGIISVLSSFVTSGQHTILLPAENLIPYHLLKIIITVATILLCIIFVLFVKFTKSGIRLKILGANTQFLNGLGVNTNKLKIRALFFSGSLACLSGLLISTQLGVFVPNQSAGRGWIALVLVFAGGRSPIGVILASVVFILVENIVSAAQLGLQHPSITIGIPFILSLVIIIVQSVLQKLIVKYKKLSF